MADQDWDPDDFVPHLPDILLTMAVCRRRLADAVTEVRPLGPSFRALSEATDAIDALAHHLTGQRGFLALADPRDPSFPIPRLGATCSPDGPCAGRCGCRIGRG